MNKDIEIIEKQRIGVDEIFLYIKVDGVEYSGCLTEIQE